MTTTSPLWALVPAKAFARGKSRLGGVLEQPKRAAFARGLFEHVTSVLRSLPAIDGVLVLTDDAEVEAAALAAGNAVQRDTAPARLNQIVDRGLETVATWGASGALVCMADLPHLHPDEVQQAVRALDHHPVVVVPDLERAGTNMLGLRPPTRMPSCFGRADSFQQHVQAAMALALVPQVLDLPSICFDVDGPEDLDAAR